MYDTVFLTVSLSHSLKSAPQVHLIGMIPNFVLTFCPHFVQYIFFISTPPITKFLSTIIHCYLKEWKIFSYSLIFFRIFHNDTLLTSSRKHINKSCCTIFTCPKERFTAFHVNSSLTIYTFQFKIFKT